MARGTLNNSAASKDQLRRIARSRRRAIPPDLRLRAARRAAQRLLRSSWVKRSRVVAVYLDSASEMCTAALIDGLRAKGRKLVVPVVTDTQARRMVMTHLDPHVGLRRGAFGIRQPYPWRRAQARIDLMILPLLAFDARGHRLGSGAGFYDRWLGRQIARPICVGLAYAAQQVERIPAEPTDQKLDAVCTERQILRFRQTPFPIKEP